MYIYIYIYIYICRSIRFESFQELLQRKDVQLKRESAVPRRACGAAGWSWRPRAAATLAPGLTDFP